MMFECVCVVWNMYGYVDLKLLWVELDVVGKWK